MTLPWKSTISIGSKFFAPFAVSALSDIPRSRAISDFVLLLVSTSLTASCGAIFSITGLRFGHDPSSCRVYQISLLWLHKSGSRSLNGERFGQTSPESSMLRRIKCMIIDEERAEANIKRSEAYHIVLRNKLCYTLLIPSSTSICKIVHRWVIRRIELALLTPMRLCIRSL